MENEKTKSNAFTDDGRLLQTEFAIKGVSEAGTIVGLACTDGVILVGINPAPSRTVEKIYKLGENAHCAVSGIFSDALSLVKYARLRNANIHEEIGRAPRLSVLCDAVAQKKQHYTCLSSARPFGVSLLYAGHEDGEYVLFSTDPSGTVNRWRAWCFGKNEDSINSSLIGDLPAEPMRLDAGLRALFGALAKARENPPDASRTMEVLLYTREKCRMLGEGEISELLRGAGTEVPSQ